jgi:hypothetical protein
VIVSDRRQVSSGPTAALWIYVLIPVVLVSLAVARFVLGRPSSLAGWDFVAGLVLAGWACVRIRRFFRFRKRLISSSDTFPATLVADTSRSGVRRWLPFRSLTLDAPYHEQPPNIRVYLLAGQSTRALSRAQEVRVRGPEEGTGPLVLLNPAADAPVLGYGRRVDAAEPGWLTVAWLTGRKALRALPGIPGALAAGTVAATRGLARASVAAIAFLVRSVIAGARGLAKTLIAAATLLAHIIARTPRALMAGARRLARTLIAAATVLARTITRVPRALIAAILTIAQDAAIGTKWVAAALGAAIGKSIRALALTAGALARGTVMVTRGAIRAVAGTPRALPAAARTVIRAAFATARAVGNATVAGLALLARAPAVARAAAAAIGRAVGILAHLPAKLAGATRSALAAVGRLVGWLRRPRLWLLYVAVPLTVLIVGSVGTALAGSSDQAATGPGAVMIAAAAVLATIGWSWLLLRLVRYGVFHTYGFGATDKTTACVLWVSPKPGWGRWLSSGRLALELPGGDSRPALLVSLFGGQRLPRLLTGEEVSVTVRPGHAHGTVAIDHRGSSSLIGFGRIFGPYKLAAPEVVTQARRVLRRDLIVYGSLSNKLIGRHRAFSRILSRGGHRCSASVAGSTQPRWYERLTDRDSVWLQLESSTDPQYVRMRLLGRQDGTSLRAGEAVSMYGSPDGRGSIIAVGSRHRTTLLGVGEPWSASERSEG